MVSNQVPLIDDDGLFGVKLVGFDEFVGQNIDHSYDLYRWMWNLLMLLLMLLPWLDYFVDFVVFFQFQLLMTWILIVTRNYCYKEKKFDLDLDLEIDLEIDPLRLRLKLDHHMKNWHFVNSMKSLRLCFHLHLHLLPEKD
jgi:hypothetical protein